MQLMVSDILDFKLQFGASFFYSVNSYFAQSQIKLRTLDHLNAKTWMDVAW